MKSKEQRKPNLLLREQRLLRGWSLQRVVDELCALSSASDERLPGVNAIMVSNWETGTKKPSPFYRERLCKLYNMTADKLGFMDAPVALQLSQSNLLPLNYAALQFSRPKQPVNNNDNSNQPIFDLGVIDKLDSAESIINLAWEAWFASRPREAARYVNKLLPGLEKIAHSLYLSSQMLQAKKLAIRSHGLLGSVCIDSSQNDTALFHYMQAHRFAEELHDLDLTATYLCLIGDVLRRQNDQSRALNHMENARDLASRASNTTRGHILQLLAYTYGDTKQEAAFERTISEATDLLAFSGEGIDTVQKEFIPFEIYEIRGKINRDLSKPINAIPYLELAEKSLTTANSVTPRWHALLEISKAQTYCDAGDIAIGIKLACKGFIMAYQCHSPHQINRVRKLLRKLEDSPLRNHSGVQDLKNLLSETYLHVDID